MKKLVWVWLLAIAAMVGYFFLLYGGLPERVATHFDAEGKPNGFQGKSDYLFFFLRFIFLINGLFGAMFVFMERIPSQWINLPGKTYWFSTPQLKSEIFEKLRGVVCLLGLFCNLAFLFTEHIIYQENTPDPAFRIPVTGGVIGILVCVLLLTLFVFWVFKPPKADTSGFSS